MIAQFGLFKNADFGATHEIDSGGINLLLIASLSLLVRGGAFGKFIFHVDAKFHGTLWRSFVF